jgi:hypothetical protein
VTQTAPTTPGTQTPVSTATATPESEPPPSAERFRSWVASNTQVPFEFEYVNDSLYRVYADDDLAYRQEYNASNEPLPEAVAISMSWADGPPEQVEFVVDGYEGNTAWRFTLNESIADDIYNHSISPGRLQRAINATDTRTEHFPATDEPMEIRHLTWAEARMSYASDLVELVRQPITRDIPDYGNYTQEINVSRYGIWNGAIGWDNIEGGVAANESIFLDLRFPRDDKKIGTYTARGFARVTIKEKWLFLTRDRPYGRFPNVHVRFVDTNGTIYQTFDIHPEFTKEALEEDGYGLEIIRTVQEYHGGPNR